MYPCTVAIQTVEMQQGVDSGHDNTESSRLISRAGSSYLMCRLLTHLHPYLWSGGEEGWGGWVTSVA